MLSHQLPHPSYAAPKPAPLELGCEEWSLLSVSGQISFNSHLAGALLCTASWFHGDTMLLTSVYSPEMTQLLGFGRQIASAKWPYPT